MIISRAPAALELDMLAIELPVRVDLDRPIVRVVSADDHAAAVADDVEALGDRGRGTTCFDDDVYPPTSRERANGGESVLGRNVEPERRRRAHFLGVLEPIVGRADRDDLAGAGQ